MAVRAARLRARAAHQKVAQWVCQKPDCREWASCDGRDECVRVAHLLLGRLGPEDSLPGPVALKRRPGARLFLPLALFLAFAESAPNRIFSRGAFWFSGLTSRSEASNSPRLIWNRGSTNLYG